MSSVDGDNIYISSQAKKKQVARESLCALLCDDASLQKSAALTLAKVSTSESAALDVLLSLVRGEVPKCMPSYSVSKSLFMPPDIWLEGSSQIEAIKADFGVNTLRECLQSPESWERSRVVALRALIVTYQRMSKPIEYLLPHVLVGLKPDSDTHLTYSVDTAISLAVELTGSLPDGDIFEYALLQMMLTNEDLKGPIMKAALSRSMREIVLLPRVSNLLHRSLDIGISSLIFDELGYGQAYPVCAAFGISIFCRLNIHCLSNAIPRVLQVVDYHCDGKADLQLLWILAISLRISDIPLLTSRRSCLTYIQCLLKPRADMPLNMNLVAAIASRPNVLRLLIDSIVMAVYHANRYSQPIYDLVKLVDILLELLIAGSKIQLFQGKYGIECMDVASLLKTKLMVAYIDGCGFSIEGNDHIEPILENIKNRVSDDSIAAYARQFDIAQSTGQTPFFELDEMHINNEIDSLCAEGAEFGLSTAIKSRIHMISDVTWACNTLQKIYVNAAILNNGHIMHEIPNLRGTVIYLKKEWCLRDFVNVALMTLIPNQSIHATALGYIFKLAAINNERALFFISPLVESTMLIIRKYIHVDPGLGIQMIEHNLFLFARLARHKLALPIVYSGIKYIFGHVDTRRCIEGVKGFSILDAKWRCLLLKHSEIPSSKVITVAKLGEAQSMTAEQKEVHIRVFRSLCKYRPEDAVKFVNSLSSLFVEFPVFAVDCCTRMCTKDVMDFGVAYKVYIQPLFQANQMDQNVSNAVGKFFCAYLQNLIDNIQGVITDEDVIDMNLILPSLLQLIAMSNSYGMKAVSNLLKSSLWNKIQGIRAWHDNKECDCNSLLDRINKKRLVCTFARLHQEFFEINFAAFIDSYLDSKRDLSTLEAHSMLISGVVDAEIEATNRVELISRRNDTVLGYNREIRRVTRDLLQTFANSKQTISAYRGFLEEDEGQKQVPKKATVDVELCVPPMQGAESGLGLIRIFHSSALFRLYGIKLDNKSHNRDLICANASKTVLSHVGGIGGNVLINLSALVNALNLESSSEVVQHMMQHLNGMLPLTDDTSMDTNNSNCDKAVLYLFGLCHFHCHQSPIDGLPKMVIDMLSSVIPRWNAYSKLGGALYVVLGIIYKYIVPCYSVTADIINLFAEYLEVAHSEPASLGWILGLCNFIDDLPKSDVSMLISMVKRIVTLIERHDIHYTIRVMLGLPLMQYWKVTQCTRIGAKISHLLIETQTNAVTDPHVMLFVAYAHYVGLYATCNNHSAACGDVCRDTTINDLENAYGSVIHDTTTECSIHQWDSRSECGTSNIATPLEGTKLRNQYTTDIYDTDNLHGTLMTCIKNNTTQDEKTNDILIMAATLTHGFDYMVPATDEWLKRLRKLQTGWSNSYKNLTVALSAIARQEEVVVTMASAPKLSRYAKARNTNQSAVNETATRQSGDVNNSWGDESAVLVALLIFEKIKTFLSNHADLDCHRDDGAITDICSRLRDNGHSLELLKALTLCKPLKITLWDVISIQNAQCNCERELVMRAYTLHGQVNSMLLRRLTNIAKYYQTFNRKLQLSFLNCVRLAIWNIDFESIRILLSYVFDIDSIDVLLMLETLIEACAYMLKGEELPGKNGARFGELVMARLLLPLVIRVISHSQQHKVALCLYRKVIEYVNETQRNELVNAIKKSGIKLKCLLSGVSLPYQAPFTFNECFAHLVTQELLVKDVVLYCLVNCQRHIEVLSHCIYVLGVNANTEQIMLVALVLMALMAERNVASYLLELLFDGTDSKYDDEDTVSHLAKLDIYEFLRFSKEPNILYYETMDPKILAKSANILAKAPGMWAACGLENTAFGKLQPMGHGRSVPSWLPKLGDASIDRRRQSLLPMKLPHAKFNVNITDDGAKCLLIDNAVTIMTAYKAYLLDNYKSLHEMRDVITFLNTRIISHK
uniref:Uncharacterized protein n=2 Tax=Babesia bovis TaxID=5865 RepID=A7AUK9_BABBO|eukprot:XP_001610188.1 hypothetical protein [Babesia bovis T2Bo]